MKDDLDSAYSDDDEPSPHLSPGEFLWLWGALAWIVIAAIVGSGVIISWGVDLIGRMLP